MPKRQKPIAIGSDERTPLTDSVMGSLRKRGYELTPMGALGAGDPQWPAVARKVAEEVVSEASGLGILFCWTGTGVSMAANKVPGARAALCADAETARGARKWNDANVLCFSLRLTSAVVAEEILEAWLTTSFDESERGNIQTVQKMDGGPAQNVMKERRKDASTVKGDA